MLTAGSSRARTAVLLITALTTVGLACRASAQLEHVLLISVDGLHGSDLTQWLDLRPDSALANLAGRGTVYPNTRTVSPSDSFPGLMALITGGTPAEHGVYYDVSYDRELSPPRSKCRTKGTVVAFDETLDKHATLLNSGGINPSNLPLDSLKGCKPVYPHQYSKLNNIFEMVHAAGRTTAWADKHPAYDLVRCAAMLLKEVMNVRGPSGAGVSDLYTPEIAATDIDPLSVLDNIGYDQLHTAATLNWIAGLNSNATKPFSVPALFGLNYQAVSVAQKQQGYHPDGSFSAGLTQALQTVDFAIGNILTALAHSGLQDCTAIIISAKHGQSPIKPQLEKEVPLNLTAIIAKAVPGEPAAITADDSILIWLNDPANAAKVIQMAKRSPEVLEQLRITNLTTGEKQFGSFGQGIPNVALPINATQATVSRTPDIIASVIPGTIFSDGPKIAEHGGNSKDDTAVALLVANPLKAMSSTNTALTYATQVAPTILSLLGLDPATLQAVQYTPDSPTVQVLTDTV